MISVLCGVLYSNLPRFQGETRCAREFTLKMVLKTPQSLPHISLPPEISGDLTKRHHRHHTNSTKSTKKHLNLLKYQLNPPKLTKRQPISGVRNFWPEKFGVLSPNSHEISFYIMWLHSQPITMLKIKKYQEK